MPRRRTAFHGVSDEVAAASRFGGPAPHLGAEAPDSLFAAGLSWTVSLGTCLFAGTIALFVILLAIPRARRRAGSYTPTSTARAAMIPGGCLAPAVWTGRVARYDPRLPGDMLRFRVPAKPKGLTLALHAATDRLSAIHLLDDAAGSRCGVAADLTPRSTLVSATALGSTLARRLRWRSSLPVGGASR